MEEDSQKSLEGGDDPNCGEMHTKLLESPDALPLIKIRAGTVSDSHDDGLTSGTSEIVITLPEECLLQLGENPTSRHNMLIALQLGFENTVQDSNKKYPDKVQAMLTAWEYLAGDMKSTTLNVVTSTIDSIYLNSLKLVFHGEWPELKNAIKTHLNVTLQRCRSILLSLESPEAASKMTALTTFVNNPWNYKELHRVFAGKMMDDEISAFLNSEPLPVLVIRIELLCDDDCEMEACFLAAVCLKNWRGKGLPNDEYTETTMNYITDLYLALLSKFKEQDDVLSITRELKYLSLEQGAALVRRFSVTHGESGVWIKEDVVAEIAAQYFLTVAMTKPLSESGSLFTTLMTDWAKLQDETVSESLPEMVRKLIQQALSAQHIYLMCKILINKYGASLKSLYIELYIRGLTSDMNEREKHKAKKNSLLVSMVEYQLSEGFLELSELVQDDVGVCRECVLTAFSVYPTHSCYQKLKELANLSSDPTDPAVQRRAEERRRSRVPKSCPLHPPYDPQRGPPHKELCPRCGSFTSMEVKQDGKKVLTLGALIKGDTMTKSRNYDVFAAPSIVLDATALGLTSQMLRDLTVVLSCLRYLPLSWAFDWSELSLVCENYLANRDNRNVDRELKYLTIDYDQFRSWPSETNNDMYPGIERGYEEFLELSDQEGEPPASAKVTKGSDSTIERKKRGRPRKVVEADPEYCVNMRPKAKKRYVPPLSSISESDTCTQDSKTGSDGCRRNRGKSNVKKSVNPGGSKKKTNDSYSNAAAKTKDVSCNKSTSIFKVDENGEKVVNTHLTRSTTTTTKLVDKHTSGPSIVKTLRMFRHQSSKKSVGSSQDSKSTQSFGSVWTWERPCSSKEKNGPEDEGCSSHFPTSTAEEADPDPAEGADRTRIEKEKIEAAVVPTKVPRQNTKKIRKLHPPVGAKEKASHNEPKIGSDTHYGIGEYLHVLDGNDNKYKVVKYSKRAQLKRFGNWTYCGPPPRKGKEGYTANFPTLPLSNPKAGRKRVVERRTETADEDGVRTTQTTTVVVKEEKIDDPEMPDRSSGMPTDPPVVSIACKVEPTERRSGRIKKLTARRRCRAVERRSVLLDALDLTMEGTDVRHGWHSSHEQRSSAMDFNDSVEPLAKKRKPSNDSVATKKYKTSKSEIEGRISKK